jgi:hypothetical protein
MPSPGSASPVCSTSRISSARPSSTLPALQVFPFTLPRLVIVALSQQRPPAAGCQGGLLCYPDDGWMGCKLCGGYLERS